MSHHSDTDPHEVVVVAFEPPPDSEACALRLALSRIQQDNYALHVQLSRAIEERDQWREAYHRSLREKAEWTTTTTQRRGPPSN